MHYLKTTHRVTSFDLFEIEFNYIIYLHRRMTMKTQQKGFTLIELMIVIAIIGILAAVAIPAYQDYIKKSKFSDAMGIMHSVELKTTELYAMNGALPETLASIGNTSGEYVQLKASGYIPSGSSGTVSWVLPTVNATAVLVFTWNDVTGKWECDAANTDFLNKYLPKQCQD